MEINQNLLEEQIEVLEKGFVISTIELIKLPIFVEQIEKELKVTEDKNKIKDLKHLLASNKTQEKGHKESLDNSEKILNKVYLLRK